MEPRRIENRSERQYRRRNRGGAWLLAGCMTFSMVFGYAGGTLASRMNQDTQEAVIQTTQTAATANQLSSIGSKTEMSVSEIAAAVADSVVEITTETVQTGQMVGQYIAEGAGSGVIISEDGYIITNNHVVEGASKISVRLNNGESYEATLVGTDAQTDIAVIKIDAKGLQPAVIGDSDELEVGELAVAVGNPLGQLGGTVTDGIISALNREIVMDGNTMTLLQTNAAINPGNSGGGLFNGRGELIGVVNAKSSGEDIEGIGFAIPVNIAMKVADELMQYGYVKGRVDAGLSLVDIQDVQSAMMYRVSRLGVCVVGVQEGSPAESAGLQQGDFITAVDGQAVSSSSEIKSIFSKHSVGDTVELTVIRGNQQGTVQLTLREYTPTSN
ncbi:MAG: S1C family serine protease [Eubacteriales bacterium]|jgi:serine protease Do